MGIPLKAMLRGTDLAFRLSMRGKGIKEGICSCIVALPATTAQGACSPDITYGVESVNVAGQSAPLQICVMKRLCMLIVLNIQR